jgi:VanZ family protein
LNAPASGLESAPGTPRRFRRFLWLWGPAILYAALVFTVSSIPLRNAPVLWKSQDKAAHFAEYAVLAALLVRALAPGRRLLAVAAAALLASWVLGALDEIHQALVPNRTPDVHDAIADAIGSTLGVVFAAIALGAGRLRKKPPAVSRKS